MSEISQKTFNDFLKKVEEVKKSGGVDLTVAEDLSIAVMNLISLEEHFFFTGAKTKDSSYYDLSGEIRSLRTRLMESLVDRHEGETWCATKHLLSTTMRLIEVGNRFVAEGDKEKANKFFEDAYRVYGIFFALKTRLISVKGIVEKKTGNEEAVWSMETLVTRLSDCCNEGQAGVIKEKNERK